MGASTSRFIEKTTAKLTYDPELEKQLAAEKDLSRKARTKFQEVLTTAQTKNNTLIQQNKLTPEGSTLAEALFKQTTEWLTQNPRATEAEITDKQQEFTVQLSEIYVEDKNRLYFFNYLNYLEASVKDLEARNKISTEKGKQIRDLQEKDKVYYNQNKDESLQTYKARVDTTMEKVYGIINDPEINKPLQEGIQKLGKMDDTTEVKELKEMANQAERDKETIEKQTFNPGRMVSKIARNVWLSFFIALYICAGLFAGSMLANDSIVRPIPMRILYFIYGFIFWLPVLVYFGVRTLAGHPPYFATFFPLYEFDPNTDVKTLFTSLFYYTDSPILQLAKEKFMAAANASK